MITNKFLSILLATVIIMGCSRSALDEKGAQKVLNNFYKDNVPESINDRHLINVGKAIVPYLLVEIQKRDMPKRGYALLALGKINDERALPVLRKILGDDSELLGDRTCALRAIWHIDKALGVEYARKYAGKNRDIDRTIELLKEGKI